MTTLIVKITGNQTFKTFSKLGGYSYMSILALALNPSPKPGERVLAVLLPEREKGLGNEGKALTSKECPQS